MDNVNGLLIAVVEQRSHVSRLKLSRGSTVKSGPI